MMHCACMYGMNNIPSILLHLASTMSLLSVYYTQTL